MKLLYGAARPSGGHVELGGKRVAFASPRQAVRAGVALCPEDRKQEGIVAIASVADNLNIGARRHFSPARMLLDATRERERARKYIERLAIKTRDSATSARARGGVWQLMNRSGIVMVFVVLFATLSLTVPTFYQYLIRGGILLLAVLFDPYRRNQRRAMKIGS